MRTVVAALIEQEGRILICQRRAGDRFALMWEFPGGKVESGETLAGALRRELLEELGVDSRVGGEVARVRHQYAGMADSLELIFFQVTLAGPPQNLAFERMAWAERSGLASYEFLPADRELVARLASEAVGSA